MKIRPYQNLYIHVPFCNGKCAYCAFYSEPEVKQEAVDAWLCRLELDAKQYAPQSVPLNTVYLGGGTPTVLPAKYVCDLIDGRSRWNVFSKSSERILPLRKMRRFPRNAIRRA